MSPVLLERKDLFKLTAITVVIVPALFVSGFIFGYYRAETHSNLQQASIEINIPDTGTSTAELREPVVPEVMAPGFDIDVDVATIDFPQPAADTNDSPAAGDATANAAAEKQEETAAAAKPADEQQALAIGGPLEPAEAKPEELLLDTVEESGARYTVQVATFGSAKNAERKVESLLSNNLNAYSTEFTSKKDRQMFNVRFGYFDTRKNALAALKAYKAVYDEEGYLVRINRQ